MAVAAHTPVPNQCCIADEGRLVVLLKKSHLGASFSLPCSRMLYCVDHQGRLDGRQCSVPYSNVVLLLLGIAGRLLTSPSVGQGENRVLQAPSVAAPEIRLTRPTDKCPSSVHCYAQLGGPDRGPGCPPHLVIPAVQAIPLTEQAIPVTQSSVDHCAAACSAPYSLCENQCRKGRSVNSFVAAQLCTLKTTSSLGVIYTRHSCMHDFFLWLHFPKTPRPHGYSAQHTPGRLAL